MFGLSVSEIFIIGIVALLVLGPERLPKVARTIGHLIGRAQRYMSDVKHDIQREIDIQELGKMKSDIEEAAYGIKDQFDSAVSDIKQPFSTIVDDMNDTATQLKQEVAQELPELSSVKQKTPIPASESHSSDKPAS